MTEPRYCLCSDPDYCLRRSTAKYREKAIAYRLAHERPVPREAQQP